MKINHGLVSSRVDITHFNIENSRDGRNEYWRFSQTDWRFRKMRISQ
jgi:hypothetical protein